MIQNGINVIKNVNNERKENFVKSYFEMNCNNLPLCSLKQWAPNIKYFTNKQKLYLSLQFFANCNDAKLPIIYLKRFNCIGCFVTKKSKCKSPVPFT